jgi:hypothetical protein
MAESFEAQRMWRPEIQRLYRRYRVFFPPHTLKDFIMLLDDADEVVSSRSRAVCEAFDDELARFLKIYRGYVGGVERLVSDIRELIRKTVGEGE